MLSSVEHAKLNTLFFFFTLDLVQDSYGAPILDFGIIDSCCYLYH